MAHLTLEEFEESLGLLTAGGPPEKLRDRFARLNAFHSRRGMNSLHALAERLYTLSSGLRRDVPANRAFQALWMEHIAQGLSERSGQKLDELADQINQHLNPDGSVKEGEDGALQASIDEYEELMARKIGGVAARLDTLQKAVPAVAAILRARPRLDVPLDPPEPEEEHDHDHEHHDHDHAHHGHDHTHTHEEPGGDTGDKD
jgi:ABC-type Zn2+ transport system substrate-binding protein/surface adhesin